MRRHGSRRDPAKERFWRNTLQRQEATGLAVGEFCAQHNLAETAFYSWRSEIRRRDREAGSKTFSAELARSAKRRSSEPEVRAQKAHPLKKRAAVEHPKFLPVAVTGIATVSLLEIALPSGVVLRIGRDCDRKTLRTVLAVVLRHNAGVPAC
jgi:hypothetical protein